MKINVIIILIATIFFGFLITKQLEAKDRVDKATSVQAINDIASEVAESIKGNEKLRIDLDTLSSQKETLLDTTTSKASSDEAVSEEIGKLKVETGQTNVTGSGVEIKFQNSLQLTQLVDLTNALRNIGADAISINGTRVVAETALTDQMGVSPVTFKVIGDKKVLADSLQRNGGIIEQIDNTGKVSEKNSLDINKVKGK